MRCYCKKGEFCRLCEGEGETSAGKRQRWPDAIEAQTRSASDQVAMLRRERFAALTVAVTCGRFMADVRR